MTPVLAGEIRIRSDAALIIGATGPATAIRSGAGAPASGLGANGDFYIDTTAKAIYGPKAAGSWGVPTVLINGPAGPQGPAGADGNTIRTGAGAPSAGLGANGDFYIDTTAKAIYGPKAAGSWGAASSLIGPTGPQGPAGPGGATYGPVGLANVGGVITPNADDGPGPHRYTATADVTLAEPTGGANGQPITVEVYASGGARTLLIADVGPVSIPTGKPWSGTFRKNTARNEWILTDGE